MRMSAAIAGAVLMGASVTAQATLITYEASNLGGSSWEYRYALTNDTLSGALSNFVLFFDVGRYENLASNGAPPGWDVLVLQPDAAIPDAGRYDALANALSTLGPGASLSGFSVTFDYLGSGTPGAQGFAVIDPITFSELDTGQTRLRVINPPPNGVPEPGTMFLIVGAAGSGWLRWRFRRQGE